MSRRVALAVLGVALVAVLAAVDSPRVIFRRSPTVADRIAGDVRRVALAVEEGGVVHAALEVWTDSDWDVEYWSSIPALTPSARVVTNDLVEQRDVGLAIAGDWLALAWVEVDRAGDIVALKVTTKRIRHRDWASPTIVEAGSDPIAGPDVEVTASGVPAVRYRRGTRSFLWQGPGATPVATAEPSQPSVCCPATAAHGQSVWTATLESLPRNGIFRVVRMRYEGPPGEFTTAPAEIPVVALPARR